jgi:hypothetical protein
MSSTTYSGETIDGNPALVIDYPSGYPDYTSQEVWIYSPSTSSVGLPSTLFGSYPGVTQTYQTTGYAITTAQAAALPGQWAAFVAGFNDFLTLATDSEAVALVDTWTTADDETGGWTTDLVMRLQPPDGTVIYIVDGIRSSATKDTPGDPETTVTTIGHQPSCSSPVTFNGDSPAQVRSAVALEALAVSDVEVELNHGAAIYSVRGKIRTGP